MKIATYNVMPTELDVYKPERWVDDALFCPEVRRELKNLLIVAGRTLYGHCIPMK